jgi:hypothetical protein
VYGENLEAILGPFAGLLRYGTEFARGNLWSAVPAGKGADLGVGWLVFVGLIIFTLGAVVGAAVGIGVVVLKTIKKGRELEINREIERQATRRELLEVAKSKIAGVVDSPMRGVEN